MRAAFRILKGMFCALLVGMVLTACHAIYTLSLPDGTGNFGYICAQITNKYGPEAGADCLRFSDEPIIVKTTALNKMFRSLGFVVLPDKGHDDELEPYLYIDPKREEYDTIVQHEFAHWMLRRLGIDDGSWDSCKREAVARELSQDGDAWDRQTAAKYGCWNFKDNDAVD